MAYTLSYSGGTITVNDGTINTDTSLQLPGRNFAGYGSYVDQNFVSLMQNFAGASTPSSSIRGQLWFDSGTNTLKYNISPTKGLPDWVSVAGTGPNTNITFGDVTANSIITDTITTGAPSIPGTITGQWTLTGGSTLTIQKASTTVLGSVKIDGSTITINGDGVISAVAANTEVGVTSVGLTMPSGLTVSGSPVTSTGTLAVSTSLNGIVAGTGSGFQTITVGSGLSYSGGTLSATGGGGGGTGTVTSVALSVPTGLSVSGSPITSSGTLAIGTSLNGIVAGTGSGFQIITVGSGLSYTGGTLSATGGGGGGANGTVTSVALSVPTGLTISGSPITDSGTLAIGTSLDGIVAGTGSGFQTITVGSGLTYSGGTLSAVSGPAGSNGTVTSVGLTMPSGLSVSGSPVTTNGTIAVTTSLEGIVAATGSGFQTITVGSGLSYVGTTLTAPAQPLGPPIATGSYNSATVPNDYLLPIFHGLGRLPDVVLWGVAPVATIDGGEGAPITIQNYIASMNATHFIISSGIPPTGGVTGYWAYW